MLRVDGGGWIVLRWVFGRGAIVRFLRLEVDGEVGEREGATE